LAAVVYRQLLDLARNPTPLPVHVGDGLGVDGYYRVTGVEASLPQGDTCGGWWPWSVTLSAVEPRDLPLHESRLIGTTRPQGLAVGTATSTRWHSPPIGATRWALAGAVPDDIDAIASDDGPVPIYSGWSASDAIASWRCPPRQWSLGGARVLTGDSG